MLTQFKLGAVRLHTIGAAAYLGFGLRHRPW